MLLQQGSVLVLSIYFLYFRPKRRREKPFQVLSGYTDSICNITCGKTKPDSSCTRTFYWTAALISRSQMWALGLGTLYFLSFSLAAPFSRRITLSRPRSFLYRKPCIRTYYMHPCKLVRRTYIQILRCSYSIWLLDLARTLPPTTQLDGFDIDISDCPPERWLPSNITMRYLDALGEIPSHLVGIYDIVQLRLFQVVVKNNDPGPLLRNMLKMLSE